MIGSKLFCIKTDIFYLYLEVDDLQATPAYQIDPQAVSYWRWSGLINSIIFWMMVLAYYNTMNLWNPPGWIFPALLIAAILGTIFYVFLVPQIRWNTWRYDVSEQEIDLYFGVFVKHRTLIPMVRVQHVDTEQGPLLRYFQLSTVTISTAAGKHQIPALADSVAAELRARISLLARVVDEDV